MASHELLSLLVNPRANLAVFVASPHLSELEDSKQRKRSGKVGTIYSYEVAAPCESFTYPIIGISVSDFVTPAWFDSELKSGSTRFDYLDKIKEPLQILSGGHASVFDVKSGGPWRFEDTPN